MTETFMFHIVNLALCTKMACFADSFTTAFLKAPSSEVVLGDEEKVKVSIMYS